MATGVIVEITIDINTGSRMSLKSPETETTPSLGALKLQAEATPSLGDPEHEAQSRAVASSPSLGSPKPQAGATLSLGDPKLTSKKALKTRFQKWPGRHQDGRQNEILRPMGVASARV